MGLIHVSGRDLFQIFTMENHDGSIYSLHRMRIPEGLDLREVELQRKYHGRIEISEQKKQNIRTMYRFLLPEHIAVFRNLLGDE